MIKNNELKIKENFNLINKLEKIKNDINTNDTFDEEYYKNLLINVNIISEDLLNDLLDSLESFKKNREYFVIETLKKEVKDKELKKIKNKEQTSYFKKDFNIFNFFKKTNVTIENNNIDEEIKKEINIKGLDFFLKKNGLEEKYANNIGESISNNIIYHIKNFYQDTIESKNNEIYLLKKEYLLSIVEKKLKELGYNIEEKQINEYIKNIEYRSGEYKDNSWEYSEDMIKHYIKLNIDGNKTELYKPFESLDYLKTNDDGSIFSDKYSNDNFKVIPTEKEIEEILKNNIIELKEQILQKQKEDELKKQEEQILQKQKEDELKKQEEQILQKQKEDELKKQHNKKLSEIKFDKSYIKAQTIENLIKTYPPKQNQNIKQEYNTPSL